MFPWETPAGNGLLGGRPQLTAGIRAGSYALECSNLRNPASIERRAGPCRSLAEPSLRVRQTGLPVLPGTRFRDPPREARKAGRRNPSILVSNSEPRNGSSLDSLALCLRHHGGERGARRRSRGPRCVARRPGLRLLQPDRLDRLRHRERHGSREGRSRRRPDSARQALLHLPQRLSLHLRPRDGHALRASGPAGRAAAPKPRTS